MSMRKYCILPGPHGWIGLVGTDDGLSRLSMKPGPEEVLEDLEGDIRGCQQDDEAFPQARMCLERYFQGDTDALGEIVLDLSGAPPFFAAAWKACRAIPAGETRSYAWLATEAGRPNAARAAGQAMAKNPLALVIPCHRVIGSNGDLHGYGAGGLGVKARLLQMEQVRPTMGKEQS